MALVLMALLPAVPGHALRGEQVDEYRVKAAFLLNFTRFVEWPADAFSEGAPVTIGILGEDPFGATLDQLVEGKTVDGRTVVVRRFRRVDDLSPCHVVFLGYGDREDLARARARLAGTPVLTVAEARGFVDDGGMISLVLENGRIRFEVNVAAAEHEGLKLSSQLLQLARIHGDGS